MCYLLSSPDLLAGPELTKPNPRATTPTKTTLVTKAATLSVVTILLLVVHPLHREIQCLFLTDFVIFLADCCATPKSTAKYDVLLH